MVRVWILKSFFAGSYQTNTTILPSVVATDADDDVALASTNSAAAAAAAAAAANGAVVAADANLLLHALAPHIWCTAR